MSKLLHLHKTLKFNAPKKTAAPMYHLSFQLPIKKLMIMLPSHGQNTAAVKIILHRAGITFYFTQKEMFLINSQKAICRVPLKE